MGEPLPICYLNGEYLPLRDARISPLDRGFLYSDGAYEVTPVYGGRPFRFQQHHDRLTRSLHGDPHGRSADARCVARALSRAHRAQRRAADLYIYVQVTRGAEYGRNHAPLPDVPRTVFAFAAPWPEGRAGWRETGLPAVTAEDTRWARCDIKSVSLLANVLLRQLGGRRKRLRMHPAARRPAHRFQRLERARGDRRRAAHAAEFLEAAARHDARRASKKWRTRPA